MNIIKISQDKLNEELSYRVLAGDSSITKLNIYNGDEIREVYLTINNQYATTSGTGIISSTLESLQDWTKAVNQEISHQLYQMSNICNTQFNSFRLNEALDTRTITFTYNKPDELNNQQCHSSINEIIDECLSLSLTPQTKHTGQLKISDKLYNLLDSLTLIIPDKIIHSNDQDSEIYENIIYDILIDNYIQYSQYNKDIHLFLIVKPQNSKINIIHKISVYPSYKDADTIYSLQAATDGIIVADDESNIINKMKNSHFIYMKRNIQIVRRLTTSFNNIITRAVEYRDNNVSINTPPSSGVIEEIKSYSLDIINTSDKSGNNIKNLDNSDIYIRTFDNIQCLQCEPHSLMFTSDYFFDMVTGYQVIPDWSLAGKLGNPDKKSKSRRKFFLLHEQPIKDLKYINWEDDINIKDLKDLWVYYESPSSSKQKTKSTAGYDEDSIIEYDNLEDALSDLEKKINNNKIKSLYLLSKQQTVDNKKEVLEKHSIKIFY